MRQVQQFSGDGYTTTAIFTKIHNNRNGIDNNIVIDIKGYLELSAETIKGPYEQIRLTLATVSYRNSINERIDEALEFLTSWNAHMDMRLIELKANIESSKSDLLKLKNHAKVEIKHLKAKVLASKAVG